MGEMGVTPPRLRPDEYDSFFSVYEHISPLLISDYDGTLAPFRTERADALPEPHTQALLGSISEAGGEVVILSGRTSEEVRGLISLPVEVWGCHGMEWLSRGGILKRLDAPSDAVNKMENFSEIFNIFPERSVEKKPSGIALHWRKDRKTADLYRKHSDRIINAAADAELRVLPFDEGIEFMLSYFSKGSALKKICSDHAASSPVCYLGDDLTDEDAFTAVKERAAGVGILVFDKIRESAADVCIHSSERNTFLEFWLHQMVSKKGERIDER